MAYKIALLTSTKPLRHRFMEAGREVEKLDPSRCMALAQDFDLIIVGSRASEDFFTRINQSLSLRVRRKFRFYSRRFFDRFAHTHTLTGRADDRDEGWKEILRNNGIDFEDQITTSSDRPRARVRRFRWTRIQDFIQDDRVTVIHDELPQNDESLSANPNA